MSEVMAGSNKEDSFLNTVLLKNAGTSLARMAENKKNLTTETPTITMPPR